MVDRKEIVKQVKKAIDDKNNTISNIEVDQEIVNATVDALKPYNENSSMANIVNVLPSELIKATLECENNSVHNMEIKQSTKETEKMTERHGSNSIPNVDYVPTSESIKKTIEVKTSSMPNMDHKQSTKEIETITETRKSFSMPNIQFKQCIVQTSQVTKKSVVDKYNSIPSVGAIDCMVQTSEPIRIMTESKHSSVPNMEVKQSTEEATKSTDMHKNLSMPNINKQCILQTSEVTKNSLEDKENSIPVEEAKECVAHTSAVVIKKFLEENKINPNVIEQCCEETTKTEEDKNNAAKKMEQPIANTIDSLPCIVDTATSTSNIEDNNSTTKEHDYENFKNCIAQTIKQATETFCAALEDAKQCVMKIIEDPDKSIREIKERIQQAKQCFMETIEEARRNIEGAAKYVMETIEEAKETVAATMECLMETIVDSKKCIEEALKTILKTIHNSTDKVDKDPCLDSPDVKTR